MAFDNKKIFIFGGTGSLGNCIIRRYIKQHTNIVNFSRDECKQWELKLKFNSDKLKNIVGDIRDYRRVSQALIRENPDIIIIAAALKRIDIYEYSSSESIQTNVIGTQNILNAITDNKQFLNNLATVCFISTDKACSPINVYGMCKALSEKLMIEQAYHNKEIKFVCTRYGNVLNSRGSIIPILHKIGLDKNISSFSLTNEKMTRFIMTLEQSVDLIEYAILHGDSGDIVIPKIISMKITDLLEIFSEKYNKPVKVTGIRPGEKLSESLISSMQSTRVTTKNNYHHIKPYFKNKIYNENITEYNSDTNLINKDELKAYLIKCNLLDYTD